MKREAHIRLKHEKSYLRLVSKMGKATQNQNSKLIIVCSNYAWIIIFNFRMPLIAELRSHGYKVIVLTEFDGYSKQSRDVLMEYIPYFVKKGNEPIHRRSNDTQSLLLPPQAQT